MVWLHYADTNSRQFRILIANCRMVDTGSHGLYVFYTWNLKSSRHLIQRILLSRIRRRVPRVRGGAASRKVAGLIPDVIIGIFHRHNLSDRTMALGLTQTLTEMSTRNISWEG